MLYRFQEKFPQVHPTAFVAETAVLVGDVSLGEGSSVWFGAVLRGDLNFIRIGSNSNVQDGSVLHVTAHDPVRVGNNVTIGHLAILHGCTIEDNALIGMGAKILDGAVVGEGAMVGAGALVPEGKVIPPKSLVLGVPGKVVRTLGEEELARIRRAMASYRELTKAYREQKEPWKESDLPGQKEVLEESDLPADRKSVV